MLRLAGYSPVSVVLSCGVSIIRTTYGACGRGLVDDGGGAGGDRGGIGRGLGQGQFGGQFVGGIMEGEEGEEGVDPLRYKTLRPGFYSSATASSSAPSSASSSSSSNQQRHDHHHSDGPCDVCKSEKSTWTVRGVRRATHP